MGANAGPTTITLRRRGCCCRFSRCARSGSITLEWSPVRSGPRRRRATAIPCSCCLGSRRATRAPSCSAVSCAPAISTREAGGRGSTWACERASSSRPTILCAMYAENGRKVSLIGWSLGGLFARELAKLPEMVRLVISIGSPFTGHPRETNAWRVYEFASGHKIDARSALAVAHAAAGADNFDFEPHRRHRLLALLLRVAQPPCREHFVVASHLGLGAHPATLFAVADRLAQPEGDWALFDRGGWRAGLRRSHVRRSRSRAPRRRLQRPSLGGAAPRNRAP